MTISSQTICDFCGDENHPGTHIAVGWCRLTAEFEAGVNSINDLCPGCTLRLRALKNGVL